MVSVSSRTDSFGYGRNPSDTPVPVPTPGPANRTDIPESQKWKPDNTSTAEALKEIFAPEIVVKNMAVDWAKGVGRLGQAVLSGGGLVDNPYDVKDSSGNVTGTRWGQMGLDAASVAPWGKLLGLAGKGVKALGEATGVIDKATDVKNAVKTTLKYNPENPIVPNVGPKSVPNSGPHADVEDILPSKTDLSRYQRAKSTVGAKIAPVVIAAGAVLPHAALPAEGLETGVKAATSISRVEGPVIKSAGEDVVPAVSKVKEAPTEVKPEITVPRGAPADTTNLHLPDGSANLQSAKAAAAQHAAELAAQAAAAQAATHATKSDATSTGPTAKGEGTEQPVKPEEDKPKEDPNKKPPFPPDWGGDVGHQDVVIPRVY